MDKVQAFLNGVANIATAFGKMLQAVAAQINAAKLLITEIAGAGATLTGIGAITGWQYAAIIGGVAVIFAIERQPSGTAKSLAGRADALKGALMKAKAAGKLEVTVDDVLKVL